MVKIGGFFGKITTGFKQNFTNMGNLIQNGFVVLSGGLIVMLVDAGLSNFGFYVKMKTEVQNLVGKVKTMLVKEA